MATAAPSSQFSGKSHYEVLGVSTDATQDQIKKAYRAMALKFHPDRNSSASAHHDMIAISRAADTLSDPVKRARYDEDGADGLDDESMGGNVDAAMEYWRAVYKKVTAEEITSFELSYRLSSDERVDVLKAYVTTKGDMNQIMMSVPCCVEADIERFADMIDAAILHGEVEKFRKFPASKSKVTCFQEFAGEAQEIEEIKQTQGKENNLRDLQALILNQNRSREASFDAFFQKHVGGAEAKSSSSSRSARQPSKKAKKSHSQDIMNDDEFERIQAEMMARRNK